MTPEQIHQKILFGYAKAAEKLGASFKLYRSSTPINPIQDANYITTTQMTASINWNYDKANRFGNAVWNACLDAQSANSPLSCQVGDYLIPTEGDDDVISDDNIYYVQSLQFDLPPQVVQCDRTIEIVRPSQETGAGNVGYVGYLPVTSELVVQGMPCSILKINRGSDASPKLPTDAREPNWEILLPNLGGVEIRIGDMVNDDLGQDYVVIINELTSLGWRLVGQQVVNSR